MDTDYIMGIANILGRAGSIPDLSIYPGSIYLDVVHGRGISIGSERKKGLELNGAIGNIEILSNNREDRIVVPNVELECGEFFVSRDGRGVSVYYANKDYEKLSRPILSGGTTDSRFGKNGFMGHMLIKIKPGEGVVVGNAQVGLLKRSSLARGYSC